MSNINPFFNNKGPFKISEILKEINLKFQTEDPNFIIKDVKALSSATKNDITFLHSNKYKDIEG